MNTECGKCSEKQKVLIAKVMASMKAKLPDEWGRLYKLHDPELKHVALTDEFISKHGS